MLCCVMLCFVYIPGDSKDKDVIGCHYLLFAVGPLDNGDIYYHGSGTTKTASNSTICIDACGRWSSNSCSFIETNF